MKRFAKLLRRKRKGMTLVETIVALIIMSLGVVVMARITATKVQEQSAIDSQYILLNIDAMLSDIYHDFHAAEEIQVHDNTGGSLTEGASISLTFDLGDGVVHLYDWIIEPNASAGGTTGVFYYNGDRQFNCSGFEVRYTAGNLYVAFVTDGERRLDMDIFR